MILHVPNFRFGKRIKNPAKICLPDILFSSKEKTN